MTNKYTDDRPSNCRSRLMAEGKAYPRSSCQACSTNISTGIICPHEKKQDPFCENNVGTTNEYPPTKVTDDEPLSVLDEVALRILIALIHPDPADGVTWYAKAPEDAYIYAERFLQHRKGK